MASVTWPGGASTDGRSARCACRARWKAARMRLGVVHGERHGLLLVDVLAGIERGGEMLGVQVLRRGDQDRVDVLVFEQVAVVQVGLGVGAILALASSRRRV